MMATELVSRGLCRSLAGCLLLLSMISGATAAAEDSANVSSNAGVLEEVVVRPGPPAQFRVGHFDDNPGCVTAKLDI